MFDLEGVRLRAVPECGSVLGDGVAQGLCFCTSIDGKAIGISAGSVNLIATSTKPTLRSMYVEQGSRATDG